jgi:hypothetical protein
MSTNTAPFAVIQICLEKTIFALLDATFRTKHITDTAFDAFVVVPDGPLSPPAPCMIFTGAARFENNATGCNFLPGSQSYSLCHNLNTS